MADQNQADQAASLRIYLAQESCKSGDVEANHLTMDRAIHAAASKGAELIVFPELFTTGYRVDDVARLAEPRDGPTFQRVSAAAQGLGVDVLYGFAEAADDADGDRRPYISLMWVGADGSCVACYRKTHLFTPEPFEREQFQPGLGEWRTHVHKKSGLRVGLAVCWDMEHVEPCRALALQGADLIVAVGANPDPFVFSHVLPVRAFENLTHVAYCNMVGGPFAGSSVVCSPRGKTLCRLSDSQADSALVEIHPRSEDLAAHRTRNPVFEQRRPQLYSALVGNGAGRS